MTVKQLIKNIITAYDPTLDLTDSSTLTDLLINPASAMMDPLIAQINYLLRNLGLEDPANKSPEEIDAVASNFLMSRNLGAKASGYVELLYLTPQNVNIPVGTTFVSKGGTTFETTRQLYITKDFMQGNRWNYPYYSSGPIPVISTVEGIIGSVKPGDINTVTGLDPAPASVTNAGAFAGGTDAETNVDFVARVLEEMITGALGSAQSIKSTLLKNFTTIQNISVRGMGDDEMLRDVVVSGLSRNELQTIIDFYGKVSGLNSLPYPESRAYRNVFYDDPNTSGLAPDLPDMLTFTSEFNTDEYAGMYKLGDAHSTKIKTLVIMNEPFSDITIDSKWTMSDAKVGNGKTLSSVEFTPELRNGIQKLRMGRFTSDAEVDNMSITLTAKFLYNILNLLKRASELPAGIGFGHPTVTNYSDLKALKDTLARSIS